MPERATAGQTPSGGAGERVGHVLDVVAFYALLLVLAMRPLISETYASGLEGIGRASASLGDPTPAVTAWFDGTIWAAAVAAGASVTLRRRRWRLTGIEIGAGILLVAAAVSTLAAGNKRLALNASTDWLTALVLLVVLANLCRDRMRIGLLLAVLSATGLASMARCTMQKTADYADTLHEYERTREAFWENQHIALDDPRVELYERRLKAAETSGFLPLSNTQGALLSLSGFALLGLRGLIVRRRWSARILFVPALLAFAMIFWTGSKGALLAAAIGLVGWLVLSFMQEELRSRWRLALLTAWLGIAGLVSAGAVYGVINGGLPGDSLGFRWNYWQVTRHIIAEHAAVGVGAMNFDSAYLAAKPVQYPEEIRDPHNFVLSLVAQWGVLGGVGLIAVLFGASWMMARTWGRREPTDTPPPVHDPQARYLGLQWMVAIAVGFFFLRLWLMRGWLSDASGTAYVFFDMGFYGLIWMLGFAGLCWMTRGGWAGDLDQCQVACLAGVFAFLLHGLIDVAMFYPGTLTPMAALGALLLVSGPSSDAGNRFATVHGWIACSVAIVGTLAVIVLVVIPVTQTSSLLTEARFRNWLIVERASLYEQAMAADPLDPTPAAELAETLASSGDADALGRAIRAISQAVSRDPRQIGWYRARANLLEMSWRQTHSMADLIGALGSARHVVMLYPNSPDDHIWLADMLVRTATGDESQDAAAEAIANYQRALDLDEDRRAGEIRKWSPARRQAVVDRMQLLMEAAASRPAPIDTADSRPASQPS